MTPRLVVIGAIMIAFIVVVALSCQSAKEFWSVIGALLFIGAEIVLAAVLLMFTVWMIITGLWPGDPQFWSAGP